LRAAALVVLVTVAAAAAEAGGPWFGVWSLNIQKSRFDPGSAPYRRATCVITPWRDGLESVCDMVRMRGGVTHLEWAGLFDGRDYPVQGVEEDVTYAYTLADDRSYEVLVKMNGAPASRSRVTISADGATMTVASRGGRSQGRTAETVLVYDRVE
jgi:hypothetical protein